MEPQEGRGDDGTFFTPAEQEQRQESPRGRLLIASCRSGTYLAQKVVGRYKHYLAEAGADGDLLYLEDEVTAVLPYLAYARQDKPTRFQREPTTAKLRPSIWVFPTTWAERWPRSVWSDCTPTVT